MVREELRLADAVGALPQVQNAGRHCERRRVVDLREVTDLHFGNHPPWRFQLASGVVHHPSDELRTAFLVNRGDSDIIDVVLWIEVAVASANLG
ncbi:hypothetical protein FQZ97_1086340 [compost metagenome]